MNPHSTKGPAVSWAGWGKWSFLPTLHRWGCLWSTMSRSGLLSIRMICTYWSKSSTGPQRWWEHLSHEEKQRELGLFCLERSQGDLVNVNKYLLGGNQKEEVRLFSLVPTDRIRDNGKKLKILKFHLNARKHFFTMWCGQAWEQLVERGCEVSILSGIQNSTRPPSWTTYSSWSYLNWGVGLHEFKKSLPTSTILCFSELILLFD